MSAATVLNDVASAIAATLGSISNLKTYSYDPKDVDSLPAATVWGPQEVVRSEPDIGDSQLGSADWHTVWSVRLFVAFDDPATGTQDARALLGQAIAAIDASRSLGIPGTVLDASLVRSLFALPSREERPVAIWDCELHAWLLI